MAAPARHQHSEPSHYERLKERLFWLGSKEGLFWLVSVVAVTTLVAPSLYLIFRGLFGDTAVNQVSKNATSSNQTGCSSVTTAMAFSDLYCRIPALQKMRECVTDLQNETNKGMLSIMDSGLFLLRSIYLLGTFRQTYNFLRAKNKADQKAVLDQLAKVNQNKLADRERIKKLIETERTRRAGYNAAAAELEEAIWWWAGFTGIVVGTILFGGSLGLLSIPSVPRFSA